MDACELVRRLEVLRRDRPGEYAAIVALLRRLTRPTPPRDLGDSHK